MIISMQLIVYTWVTRLDIAQRGLTACSRVATVLSYAKLHVGLLFGGAAAGSAWNKLLTNNVTCM